MAMVIYFAICFGKITFTTLNAYGSFMSLSTIVSGFRRQASLSKRARILFVVLMVAISCVIALLSEPAFLKNFTHFLLFLLAFFVPWSAISLTDYYLISAGAVDIPALSDPQQRYGYWNIYAIVVYVAGVLIQLPFIENPLYHGSLTWLFAGNDVSWIIGWFGTGALYYALRRFDRRVAADAERVPGLEPMELLPGADGYLPSLRQASAVSASPKWPAIRRRVRSCSGDASTSAVLPRSTTSP